MPQSDVVNPWGDTLRNAFETKISVFIMTEDEVFG